MSIKNNKPNYNSKYHQSYFVPENPDKYVGEYPIICRSGMEKKFCIYLDTSEHIVSWSSEPLAVKYFNKWDNKYHNYYPDFVFKTKDGIVVIVEVKPKRQLQKPKEPEKKTKKSIKNFKTSLQMYITNMAKINAVKEYAKVNNQKFILVTESELKKLKV